MFGVINKDEMEECVQRDFAALNEKLEMEHGMCKKMMKRPVGRPKKEMDVVLLTPKVEPEEHASKKTKVRGPYTNWFLPNLWKPILAVVKQHKNLTAALNYLRTKHKVSGETYSVYDKLSRGSLYEWFSPTGILKERYKQHILKGSSSFTGGTQHGHLLSQFPELEEEIIKMLEGHRDAGQPLFATTVRGLI